MKTEQAVEKFAEFLRTKGLRVTAPRREVIELAWATRDHFSAEELTGWARRRKCKASRATVYRTLALLSEGNFLGRIERGGHTLYEHILGHKHHDHLICLGCGKIVEFVNDTIESEQQKVVEKYKFKLISHTHILEGVCQSCSRAGN